VALRSRSVFLGASRMMRILTAHTAMMQATTRHEPEQGFRVRQIVATIHPNFEV